MSEKDKVAEQTAARRSFGVFLRQLNDGEAELDLSKGQQELLTALREEAEAQNVEAKGQLILTVSFKVDPKGQCEVGYQVKTKEPVPQRTKSHLWLDKGDNIAFENPKQEKLFPREIPGGKVEIRDVPARGE